MYVEERRVIRPRKIIQVAAPLVAIATLMIGLRIGAGDAVRAVIVTGAPSAKTPPSGKTRLAWQLLSFREESGVRETITLRGLTVTARAKGQEARWQGDTNVDGVAELSFEFEGDPGKEIELEVRAEGDPMPLASGSAEIPAPKPSFGEPSGGALSPNKREGPIDLDLIIETGRLVTGFPTPVWIHVVPPAGIAPDSVTLEAEPEVGLDVAEAPKKPCANGWTEMRATALGHVVGISIKATSGDAKGFWFGALPVAAGAFFPSIDRVVPEDKETTAVLIAPNPRNVVYAEVDDERGRAIAAGLDVKTDADADAGDATPRARFTIPPLAPGLHWLIVSGEPRGGEKLRGATVARPFLVGAPPAGASLTARIGDAERACDVGPYLAQHPTSGLTRYISLDGFPARNQKNRERHRTGMFIAMVSLVAAAILEVLLLAAASREARIQLQLAELDEDAPAEKVTAKPPGGGLAIGLLVAILGFALLAALLVMKG
jgi:hypothetical protein